MEENPRDWHHLLLKTLWVYIISKRDAIKVSPFSLVYGHDDVLPMEVVVPSLRVVKHNGLILKEYNKAMIMELKNIDEERMQALNNLIAQKKKISRIYNKKVKKKSFEEGELVWKVILPVGVKDREFGKWSPSWEGPFKIHKVLMGNAY